jgi:hypothetical protein
MLGLTVVMDSGLPITPAASLTRNLLRGADFLPSLYAFGVLSMLFRHDFKRLGDIAAGTLVVHAPQVEAARAPPPPAPARAPAVALSARAQAAIVAWAGRVAAAHRGARRRARRDRRPGRRAARDGRRPRRRARSASPTGCSAGDDAAAVRGQARRRLERARGGLGAVGQAAPRRAGAGSRPRRGALSRRVRAPGDRRIALVSGLADRPARRAHGARPPARLRATRLRDRQAAPALRRRLPGRRRARTACTS